MAKGAGLGQNYFAHGRNISGDVGAMNTAGSPRGVMDSTGINSSANERILTLTDGIFDWTGFYNDAADRSHEALSGLPTTDVIHSWHLGTTAGNPAATLVAKQTNYDFTRPADGSLAINVQALGASVGMEWGEVLLPYSTIASAGNSASLNNGGNSTNGLQAVAHVESLSGTSVTINIQESSDDGGGDTFATIGSFAAVTVAAAPTAERITITDNDVEQYLRVNASGTFTNAVMTVSVRRGTAGDNTAY